jgi:hypothetical protein
MAFEDALIALRDISSASCSARKRFSRPTRPNYTTLGEFYAEPTNFMARGGDIEGPILTAAAWTPGRRQALTRSS